MKSPSFRKSESSLSRGVPIPSSFSVTTPGNLFNNLSGITGWTQRVGLASVVSAEHCSTTSTTWSVTNVAAAAHEPTPMFLQSR